MWWRTWLHSTCAQTPPTKHKDNERYEFRVWLQKSETHVQGGSKLRFFCFPVIRFIFDTLRNSRQDTQTALVLVRCVGTEHSPCPSFFWSVRSGCAAAWPGSLCSLSRRPALWRPLSQGTRPPDPASYWLHGSGHLQYTWRREQLVYVMVEL